MEKGRTRVWLAATGVFLAAGLTAALVLASSSDQLPGDAFVGYGGLNMITGGGTQPITGEAVDFKEVRSRTSLPIPVFSTVETLRDVCTGDSTVLTMVTAWASAPADRGDEPNQIGLTYTHGLWMSISPRNSFAPNGGKSADFPPLEGVFPPDQMPTGVSDGTVRGHAAWVSGRSDPERLAAACSVLAETPDAVATPGVEAPLRGPGGAPVQGFDSADNGGLMWAENGVVIDLAGPYTIQELQRLADGITWIDLPTEDAPGSEDQPGSSGGTPVPQRTPGTSATPTPGSGTKGSVS